jgi:hypothetical protein
MSGTKIIDADLLHIRPHTWRDTLYTIWPVLLMIVVAIGAIAIAAIGARSASTRSTACAKRCMPYISFIDINSECYCGVSPGR